MLAIIPGPYLISMYNVKKFLWAISEESVPMDVTNGWTDTQTHKTYSKVLLQSGITNLYIKIAPSWILSWEKVMWWGPKHGWPVGWHIGDCWVNKHLYFICACLNICKIHIGNRNTSYKTFEALWKAFGDKCYPKSAFWRADFGYKKSNQWKDVET